jgi:uncharacterized protein (TIGR03083 family)
MTSNRTFASWVEPYAARWRDARAELLEFARSTPAEGWSRPSPLEGWSCKDLLAHAAANTGRNTHRLTEDVLARRPIDLAALTAEVDATNASDIEARRGRSVDELIAELEEEGEAWQDLMTKFGDEDKDYVPEGAPFSVSAYFEQAAGTHDREHLDQLRSALPAGRASARRERP